MADDRRIIFGTHIIPKESADTEESIPQKWTIMRQDTSGDAMAKTLGGKGICTDLADNQANDAWVSFAHHSKFWEDWADATDSSGSRWEDVEEAWGHNWTIGTAGAGVALSQSGGSNDVAFLYLKNTGITNEVAISLTGTGGAYNIIVPPGGSVCLRGGDSGFNREDVYAKALVGETTIEFVLANK
jgi:hypothetical protein